jgi:hypothetical protein
MGRLGASLALDELTPLLAPGDAMIDGGCGTVGRNCL